MKHAKLLDVSIGPKQCVSEQVLHAYLQDQLDLPTYYGANLSALADCLSEFGQPLLLTVNVSEKDIAPGMQAYLLRFVQVCAREALVNPHVSLIIEHE